MIIAGGGSTLLTKARCGLQNDTPGSPLSQLVTGQKVEFVLKSVAVADGLLSILGELPAASEAPRTKKKK